MAEKSNQVGFDAGVVKLTIGSVDKPALQLTAQYNPAQLDLQRAVSWERANNKKDNLPDHRRPEPPDNDLAFLGGGGRTLSLELLFDGVETGTCIEPQIQALDEMATLTHPMSKQHHDNPRPHQCVIVWGTDGIKPLVCVIESLGVKYQMFDRAGRPLRATVTIKVQEASITRFDRLRASLGRRPHVNGYVHGKARGLLRYVPPPPPHPDSNPGANIPSERSPTEGRRPRRP